MSPVLTDRNFLLWLLYIFSILCCVNFFCLISLFALWYFYYWTRPAPGAAGGWWKACSRHGDGSRRNSPLGDTMIELNKVIGDSFQVIVDGSTGSGNYYQAWPFLIDSRDLQRRGYARTNLVWASGSWNYCQMESSPKRPRPQSIRLATEEHTIIWLISVESTTTLQMRMMNRPL